MVYSASFSKSPAFLKEERIILPEGAVSEVSGALGSGKTEWLLNELSRNPLTQVAWVEVNFSAYPCSFPRFGVSLNRVLFVECQATAEALWSVRQILKSQAFGQVVLTGASELSEMDLRRLQLLSEKSQVSLVLLNEQAIQKGAWPISVQIEVSRKSEGVSVRTLKKRMVSIIPMEGQKAWQKLGLLPIG